MATIKSFYAREILDSRGIPTVEATCLLESGHAGTAAVPSGASVGVHEAWELRDGDSKRYAGRGVLKAVSSVNQEINYATSGRDYDQKSLDRSLIELDGTANKARLGANAILAASLSFARANANENSEELFRYLGNLANETSFKMPEPMFNVINGGKHADSGLDIQEFGLVPTGFDTFSRKVQAAGEVIYELKKNLERRGLATSVGDEGGFAPKLSSNEEAFELLVESIKGAGYSTDEIKLGIDAAATSFAHEGGYRLRINGDQKDLDSRGLIEWYHELVARFPIIFIEDGLSEDDWQGFQEMNGALGKQIELIGDDLLVTNIERIKEAHDKDAVNAVLIKLNQIGTLTETIDAILLAREYGWAPFVSHRSGETTDTFIADLAVGLSAKYIKAGSLARGERVAKYNRLLEIESILTKQL
jgi:enolase